MDEEHKSKSFYRSVFNGRRPYGTQQGAEWQGIFSLQPYFSGWVEESFPLISSSLQLLLLILVKLQFKIAIPIEHQLDRLGVDFVLFCFHYSIEAGNLY